MQLKKGPQTSQGVCTVVQGSGVQLWHGVVGGGDGCPVRASCPPPPPSSKVGEDAGSRRGRRGFTTEPLVTYWHSTKHRSHGVGSSATDLLHELRKVPSFICFSSPLDFHVYLDCKVIGAKIVSALHVLRVEYNGVFILTIVISGIINRSITSMNSCTSAVGLILAFIEEPGSYWQIIQVSLLPRFTKGKFDL